ncbi:PD-(D/E)XK nuclease family protein [Paraflavisolibacter sp. H34]|uniref:PD-(D/E)XK nuclease family protein n=1 Tax=Huijunlia imazamoxiresistens TaxID=3127457 RepID=UPI003018E8E0
MTFLLEKLPQKFTEAYNRMDAEQRMAVDRMGACADVRLYEYPSPLHEMEHIALRIKELGGAAGASVGVLYREDRQGAELAACLQRAGIPFTLRRRGNLLDEPPVQQLILLLHYLSAENDLPYSGDEMLFRILHFECWGIPPVEMVRASREVAALRYGRKPTSLRRYLHDKVHEHPTDLFWQPPPASLKEALTVIEGLIAAVPHTGLSELVDKVMAEGGFEAHCPQGPLDGFRTHVREECRRHPQLRLESFLHRLGRAQHEGLVLPEPDAGKEAGVQLRTVHDAPDQEFDHLFFAGCTTSCWEKHRKPLRGFRFADALLASPDREEQQRRLFYTALARARTYLYLSCSSRSPGGQAQEPTRYLSEIFGHPLPVEKAGTAGFTPVAFRHRVVPRIAALDDELEHRAVKEFSMSVSALNAYLRCPLAFYYHYIVRVPSGRNEAAEFGSAVHHALEQLFRKMQAQERFPPVETLLDDFAAYMHRHRSGFTPEGFARRLEQGFRLLPPYYHRYIGSWNKVVSVEFTIRHLLVDEVPLKGRMDKIEFRGRDALVVDYKTGDLEKAREKLVPPSDSDPEGGDYWRQAVFYVLLLQYYTAKDWNVTGVAFDFVEPDQKGAYVREMVMVGPADLATVKNQVTTAWNRVQDRDFYTGCGREGCYWCSFVKTSKLAVALYDLPPEEDFRDGC